MKPYTFTHSIDADGCVIMTFTPKGRTETKALCVEDYASGAQMDKHIRYWIKELERADTP